jgi:hypothetical protein
MANAFGFAAQIDRELEAALGEWRRIIRKIALTALTRVVNRTPVDTGRARGNWFVQIGEAGVEVTTEVDPDGSVTISRGAAVIATYQTRAGFENIAIYNNLPYIEGLENGASQQAPAGMVAVTVAELEASL